MTLPFDLSLRSCHLSAYLADDWIAVSGVNEGEPLTTVDDMVLGDCYALRKFVTPQVLDMAAGPRNTLTMRGPRTRPIELRYNATLTLMSDTGHMFEALTFVAGPYCTDTTRMYKCPLDCKDITNTPYCLIEMQQEDKFAALAKAASMSTSRQIRPPRRILRGVCKTLRQQM